jgi:timeless
VLEILLVLGQELELRENSQYNLLMMELLHHLLKSQDPAAVARSEDAHQSSSRKAPKRSSLLASKLQEEKSFRRRLVGVRHGHFGGTWMTQQLDGKRQYVAAAASSQQKQRFGMSMRRNRKSEPFVGSGKSLLAHSTRLATDDGPTSQRANTTLHNFCLRFVKDCYGPVMKSLKNEFRRDSVRLEEGDKVVFFRLIWFFCQWWRLSRRNKSLGQLIFTMDVFTFNLVLNSTDTFYQHKKHARLAQAVALYSEMMLLLHDMQKSKDATENDIALGLLNRLFYVGEPLDRLPKLLSRWTPGTNTREYLCDLCELCHVSLKLLEGSSKNDSVDTQQKKISGNNNVEKMKLAVAEFDVMSYFCRKIVSNQLVNMYVHLLGQYRLNSANINHHIIAMFLRLSHTEIASPDIQDVDSPINMLGSRRVTYEPMLYNIHLFLVMEKILSDCAIRNDKDFASLVNFCSSHMYKFWSAAQDNPMAYIECLFRHLAPHRFCESFTNLYVSEELRMVAERELLLEQQRHETDLGDSGNGDYEDEDDEEVEFTGEPVQGVQKEASGLSDSEEEVDSENIGSLPSQKDESAIVARENKRGKDNFAGSLDHERSTKKAKTIESDDEVDFSGGGSADVSNTMFTDDD